MLVKGCAYNGICEARRPKDVLEISVNKSKKNKLGFG
jgi:hypothetical protein